MAVIALRYDLRAPAFAGVAHETLYRTCLEQCAWADAHGLDLVVLSEHHGVDDGYLSTPVTLAAAIAGRTQRLRIQIAAVLVPLHDPVRLAEQLATVALVSGGRLGLVAGVGYRQEEFDMAGVDRAQRGRLAGRRGCARGSSPRSGIGRWSTSTRPHAASTASTAASPCCRAARGSCT